jgi:hypothetical protein
MLFDAVSTIESEYPFSLTTNSWPPLGVIAIAAG